MQTSEAVESLDEMGGNDNESCQGGKHEPRLGVLCGLAAFPMSAQKVFRLGVEFPREGFVQWAIERHFQELGYQVKPHSHADLYCVHPMTGEMWLIEAKGLTSDVGLDFRTGLGQLIQLIEKAETKYGIAVPNIPQFIKQCRLVSTMVRNQLNLHWLLVAEDGMVSVVPPETEQAIH